MIDNEVMPGVDSLPPAEFENAEQVAQETQKVLEATPQPKPQGPTKEDNLRILRERLEQEKRERERMEQRLAEIESRNKPAQQEPDDWDLGVKDDDIVEGKHISKVSNKMRQLEKKIAEVEQRRVELQRQSEESMMLSSIKADFPDIDKVVNEATMESLRSRYPHIERAIKSTPDIYGKAAAAYQAIKDLGIYVEDTYTAEKERVQKNVTKPKPTTAATSALTQADIFANGLTPELKDKLHKEMLEAIKAR